MPMFKVEGGMGVLVIETGTARKASGFARRRYGDVNAPFKTSKVGKSGLADHLHDGAVFFEADGTIMEKARAYDLAGIPMVIRA